MPKKSVLIFFFFISTTISAADIFVDQSAAPGGDGSTWTLAFQTIEEAVAAAAGGDTIFIAEGIYRPVSEIDITVPLTIRGSYPQGGGTQDFEANVTQIQADFDPGNLLLRVFDIAAGSATTMEGLRFYNTRSTINSRSNLILDNVSFERFSNFAVFILGDIDTFSVNNANFSDFSGTAISQSHIITDVSITNTIFQKGTNTAISLSDEVVNFNFTDITLRDFNTSDRVIHIRDLRNVGTITDLKAYDNSLTNSGSLFLITNSNVSFSNAEFKNNTGQNGTPCIQTGDAIVAIDGSVFEGNSIIGTGPKSVFLIWDTIFTVTNSLFENNHAQGTFSALADIRADDTDAQTIFDNCVFRGNSILGSSQQGIIDASYDTNILINNCVFDANSSPGQFVVDSFAASGVIVTNSTFRNHSVGPGVLSIDYVERGTGGGIRVEGNTFTNNVNTTVNLFRMTDFNFENNQFYGEVLIDIDDSGIGTMTNDYFQGNASGSRFMLLEDVNLTLNQVAMISTQQNGNHRLINSNGNTALTLINSTFSATDFNNTNVSVGFNADLLSRVRNSVIWSGSDLSQSGVHGNTSNLQVRNSLVKSENPAGAGNLNGDLAANTPIFLSPENADFREQRCSPTVNAGNNSFTTETADLNGDARVFQTTVDIGAYEIQTNQNSTCTSPALPDCVTLSSPANGQTNVTVDTNFNWPDAARADGYRITASTTPGGNDIIDNVTVFSSDYDVPFDFEEGQTIYVTITSFNESGDTIGCTETSFTTASTISGDTIPNCSNLVIPLDGATGVEVDADIRWSAASGAEGYLLNIGSTSSGTDIRDNFDVGDNTVYDLPIDLPENTEIFVTITPYNDEGQAMGCVEESFFTAATSTLPGCTTISTPLNNATYISPGTTITWNAVPNADGYRITSTSTSGRNEVTDLVLTTNTWDPIQDYDYSDTVTITIVPYNASGPATGCTAESFTTAGVPACTTLSSPVNFATGVSIATDLSWNAAANATGYRLTVGTTAGGSDILNDFNVGNNLTYDLPNDLPENTQIYVTIVPYNPIETAFACFEESFRTETSTITPSCTSLTSPTGNNVAIGTTQMIWNAVANATGYRITITGTTNNNLSDVEVNGTAYNFPNAFLNGETATVTIIPFNGSVNATGCTSENFTIETAAPTGNAFITTWQTTTTNEAITIPTTGGGYNYTVDWGDGNITTGENGNATHTYTNPGIYTVSITGDFPRIFFNTNGNPTPADNSAKILTIEQWGDNPWTSMESAFTGCINLTGNFTDTPDLSNVTSTMGMFATCRLFNSNIDNWNMSSVTNMAFMFQNNASFNQPLNSWDVSNVGNMFIMFQGARIFDQPLDNWNVENVTNADRMLDQVSLSTANYDALLIAWNAQNLQPDVLFSGGDSQYCEGASARANMIASDGWVISDDGVAGPTVTELADQTAANSYTLPAITGTQLTGAEAYYTQPNGGGTAYNDGETINFTDFPSYPVTIYIYDGSGSCASEESFELTLTSTTLPTVPACTSLISPTGTDVAIGTTQMTWNAVSNVTGYRITITGTANNNVSDVEVSGTSYNFNGAFVNSETVTVTIIPYNTAGAATGCTSESFTIVSPTPTIPSSCANLINPINEALNVAVDTPIAWEELVDATGYRITIGSTTNGTDILNNEDVGFLTSYNLTTDLPYDTRIYVSITPYNAQGDAIGCLQESFTTEVEPLVESEYGFSPNGDGINDFWEIIGIENSPENIVNIYNRWGDLVFTISNYDNQNNVFRGEANNLTGFGANTLPNGTYFFHIQISGTHNLKKLKGFVVLKR